MSSYSPQRYPLWLFDLDGTLVDTAPDLHRALNVVLRGNGHEPVDQQLVRDWVGAGARQLLVQALSHQYPQQDPKRLGLDALHQAFLEDYQAHIADCSQPYPGVLPTLERLRQAGARMAVVTNKYEGLSHQLLSALNLDHWFATVIGGDTLSTRKPGPAPLLEACRRLHGTPQQALMIGDSSTDIGAARAAGIPVVCVSYGYNHGEDIRAAGADAVVDSLTALF